MKTTRTPLTLPSSFVRQRRVWCSFALLVVFALFGIARGQEGKDKDAKPANLGANKDLPLVERLIAARREYQATLRTIRKHYVDTGDIQRARWAEEELLQ